MFAVEEKYQPKKWRAVVTGAFVCGIFGPAIGALLTLAREAIRQKSFRGAGDVFLVFPYLLPAAVFVMGPAGLIVGSAGSLVLQALSARVESIKALGVCAAALGLALGTAVPLIEAVLSFWSRSSISEVLPLSMAVGHLRCRNGMALESLAFASATGITCKRLDWRNISISLITCGVDSER